MINILRPLIFIALLYTCALLQASFLPHFSIAGQVPNLVFILFFILVFFGEDYLFIHAAVAGFFLDMFFLPSIGISIVALYGVWGLQKANTYIFKKSYEQRALAISFILSYAAGFIFYTALVMILSFIFRFSFAVDWNFFIGLAYNIVFALIGFFVFKKLAWRQENENQLKLF